MSEKLLLRMRESIGFPPISRIARFCLAPCVNAGPWLIECVELDLDDFASESATNATTSCAWMSALSAVETLPHFDGALLELYGPRLLPFPPFVSHAFLAFVAEDFS